MSDCRHAGTDVPIIVTGHDNEPTIDQYRETHIDYTESFGEAYKSLSIETYLTADELRELVAMLREMDGESV